MLTTVDAPFLARKMADCLMAREGVLQKQWSYDYSVVHRGMEMLYARTGERKYFDYIQRSLDAFLSPDGSEIRGYDLESHNLDFLCLGKQLLYLYRQTKEQRYFTAASLLRRQLYSQPRTPEGGFWHKACYPEQMWLDGLHMAAPFYLRYALETGEGEESVNDVTWQLRLAYERTLNPATGLNCHGWDAARRQNWADPVSGRSTHAWGRAAGWYMMALADVLELLPENAADRGALTDILKALAERLLSARQDGVWQQVLDCPGRAGNYAESSGSSMIVYALLKGARLGLLSATVGQEAQSAFDALVRHFVGQMRDGTLFLAKCCQCAGLGGSGGRDGSFDYYVSEPVISYDLKGTGAFIQAACEMERTLEK